MEVPEKPYFLENEKWYVFDAKECRYYLTPDAPKNAVKSYKNFYNIVEGETPDKVYAESVK